MCIHCNNFARPKRSEANKFLSVKLSDSSAPEESRFIFNSIYNAGDGLDRKLSSLLRLFGCIALNRPALSERYHMKAGEEAYIQQHRLHLLRKKIGRQNVTIEVE